MDFITDVPEDSVVSATLFFKTNLMEHYQEFSLDRSRGTYRFKYVPETYPGTHLQYYFIIETKYCKIVQLYFSQNTTLN